MKDFLQGKWLGHPLHPAIVHIPTSVWPAALIFDILTIAGIGGNALVRASTFLILLGLLAAVAAMPFGLADWWDIGKDKPAWKLGVFHMVTNMIGTAIWSLNLGVRFALFEEAEAVYPFPLILSITGVLLLFIAGYLGGRMVYGYGVSVARLSKDKWREIAEKGGGSIGK